MPAKIPRLPIKLEDYKDRLAVDLNTCALLLDVSLVTLYHWRKSGRLNVEIVSPRIIRVKMSEIRKRLANTYC